MENEPDIYINTIVKLLLRDLFRVFRTIQTLSTGHNAVSSRKRVAGCRVQCLEGDNHPTSGITRKLRSKRITTWRKSARHQDATTRSPRSNRVRVERERVIKASGQIWNALFRKRKSDPRRLLLHCGIISRCEGNNPQRYIRFISYLSIYLVDPFLSLGVEVSYLSSTII